jgi:predicted nuclease of predicted toxin-antitoxin system
MKLLLDTCVWGGARKDLERSGHNVVWAGDWPEDPGDAEILSRAHSEGRILITLDKDFGEMAIVGPAARAGWLACHCRSWKRLTGWRYHHCGTWTFKNSSA